MTLQASLQEFSVAQILKLLHAAHKSGRLNVEGVEGTVVLYVKDGQLQTVETPGRSADLATFLVGSGKLRPEEARELRAGSIAEMAVRLVESHRLSREEVAQALRQHHRDAACNLFTWSEGSFVFEPEEEPSEGALPAPQPLEHILIEGQRRLREWESLRQQVPHLDVAVRLPQGSSMPAGHVDLSPDEWAIISAASRGQSLHEIQRQHRLSDYRVRRAVVQLVGRGLVELEATHEPPPQVVQEDEHTRRGFLGRLRGH